MNITEIRYKIKDWLGTNMGQTFLIILILILSNIGSFYLGQNSIQTSLNNDNLDIQNNSNYSLADPELYPKGSLAAAVYMASNSSKIAQNGGNIAQSGEVGVDNLGGSNTTAPRYVASTNGRVYYYTWCAGAKNIKPEKRVYFKTAQDARGAGLKPSTACPDLD